MFAHFRRGSVSPKKKARGTTDRAALRFEQLEARENPAPIATVTGLANANPFLGDNVNYSFTFANTDPTDTGFSPFFDLIVETSGPDGTTNLPPASLNPTTPGTAADGFVGLSGATNPLVTVSGLQLTPVGTPTVLTAGQTTYVNPFTGQTLSVPAGYGAGDTIYTYQLPFGSFTPGQNTQVSVQLPTSRLADLGTPLDLTVRPGFRDTDGNPNVPLVPTPAGTHLDASATATPKLYDLIKTYVGPENETATGPNYVRRYRLSVDIATGQTINGLQLTDDLGATMQLAGINGTNMAAFLATSGLGNNVFTTANLSGTATATAPDGTVTYNFGNVTGVAGVDAVFEFDFFVPRDNSAGAEILPQPTPPGPNPPGGTDSVLDTNTASSAGTWSPLDSRDPQNQNVAKAAPDNGPHTLQEHSVAVQKTVDIVTIANPNAPTGGGVVPGQSLLRYTINFQVSDYYAVNDLFLEDVLGDGQRLYLAGGLTPTLTVQNPYTFAGGGTRAATSTGAFGGANTIDFERRYTIRTDTDSDPSAGVEGYAATGPTGGPFSAATTGSIDGSTFLRFNISDELIARGLSGVLVGGEIADGGGNPQNARTAPFGPAQGTIVFWAIAKSEYSDDFPSGDRSVDQGDRLTNSVPLIQGSHLDTNDLSDGTPTQLGTVGTDNSGTSVTIANGVQTKTVFAINNTQIPTQGVADTVFSVQAGDRITYKLTYTLPISSFEDLVLIDIPPLPVMQVGSAGQYTFDRTFDGSFNPFEIEVAPDDTFFGTFGSFPTPTITTDPLANELRLDFGDFEDVQARPTTISLLVTFPVSGDTFVGDLFLTNQLRVNEGNTFLGTTTVEDLRRIQLVRPVVTIDKGIVGFGTTGRTLGGIAFTAPNDPPTGASTPNFSGTVDAPAEADAIGGANLAAADGADAGDRVRYAIVAQNTGRGDAYDVVIEDRVQPGYDIPATFAGLNLNVRRGDGTLLSNFAEVDAFARVATAGALTGAGIAFSTTSGGQFTNVDRALDTVMLNTNDLVLVKDQTTASQNGVYRVTAVDAATNTVTLTRDVAFDTAGELSNSLVAIMGGTSANRFFQAGAVATLNASAVNYTLQAATQDYYAIYDPATGAFRLLLSDNYTAGNVNSAGEVPDDRAGSLSRRESTPLVSAGDNPPVTLITNGSNTVVVQYDLILSANVAPNQSIVNTAEVTNLSTSEGGVDTTDPTLVTGATPIADTATAIVQVPEQSKTLIGTEVTEPGNSATNQATIGELVTYEVVLTIPEGGTPGANLFDQLDEGLAFVDILDVTLTSGLSTSTGLTVANNGAANAATLAGSTTFGGSNNKNVTFALGDITNANRDNAANETITIRYRAVVLNTNSVPGDADGNQAGDQRNNAARLRWTNNDTTLALVSAANVTIVEPQLTTTKDVAVQPAGTGAFSAFGQTVRADAGDNIRYQITIANGAPSGSTTAFDVTLSDQLPTANFSGGATAFTLVSVDTTGTGTVRRDGASHTLTLADFEITAGGVLRLNQAFRYDIEPDVSIVIVVEGTNFLGATGQLVDNVADVRWSSLEQDPGNRAGNGATNGVQRTGADGEGNGLNNYADADNAVIESPVVVRKTLVSTSEGSTSTTNVAVGEIARFRLVASIPEGTTRNFQIQDALPSGLAFLNDGTARFAFVSTNGNVLSSAGITNVTGLGTPAVGTGGIDGNEATLAALLSANVIGTFNDDNVAPGSTGAGTGEGTVYANGADVFFRFGDLSNTDNDTDFEYVVIEFNALVLNDTANQAGTALANRMTILADTNNDGTAGFIDVVNDTNGDGTGANEATTAANDPNNDATGTPALSAPVTLNVVEPAVTVAKSVVSPSPASGDPGDTITFEIVLTNGSGTNSTTAFDVALSDVVPTSFENVSFVAGSLTSTGTVSGLPTSPTITGNSISLAFDSMAPGATVTFRVTATINDNGASAPAPGSTVTNTANVTYTSLPGASGTGGAWTGTAATSSTVPGAAGTATGERTGADGEGGALNDYADSDPADVTLNSHQVGGLLYHDADNDGVRDAGEALITDSTTFRLTGTDVAGNAVSIDVTTTTGAYNFTGLRAGTYTITQLDQPTGFLDGRDTAGTSSPGTQFGGTGTGATDDRGTPTTPARDADAIGTLVITGGPDSKTGINYNFGELMPASLGNFVFLDDNGNGRQDGGPEVGINNVSVSLSGTDDTGRAVSLSTTTAGGGLYQFENLRPGSYTVTFANTDGTVTYARTVRDSAVATDATDSDGDPATGTTGSYTLASGDSNQTVDQGLYVPVSLGDRVYFDFDADGAQDAGEPGIPGASIEVLWLGPDGAIGGGDDRTFTTTTGTDGIWTVDNLPPGSYRVTSTLPANFTLTDSLDNGGAASAVNPVTVSTTSGVNRTDVDFGYRGNASLGDRVYIDQDGDGVQDANEVGLPGVTVTLRLDGNNDGDFTDPEDGLFTTVTGANGAYLFENLIPGNYQVSVPAAGTGGVPDNAVLTDSLDNGALNASATVTTNIAAGENERTIDFGYRGNASVGDRVWIDQDRDGMQDPSEPGIPGATVQLRWAGQDGALDTADDVLFTTTTGANGVYLFDGLLVYGPSDDFRATVTALPIAGLTPTADLDSAAPNGDGTAEFVVSGTEGDPLNDRRDVDFGYDGLGSLSGTVYHDLNNDGIIQANEPRISGVLVTLTGVDLFGNPVLDPATGQPYTATTDANGNYSFNTVIPGTYTITETQPANYNDGIDTSGTLGGNPAVNDRVTGIVVGPNQDGTQYNFGERGTFLSGTVYRDDNRNGALQTGEPGIAGVVLQLFAADGVTPITDPNTGAPYTATTDANGFYTFDDILPGSYVVRETQPAGFADSPAGPGVVINATVPLAGLPNQNFGEVLGSLAGSVYVDANNNGTRDPGEAGISGVTVTLTGTDANNNPVTRTATTTADGSYRFDNLLSGTYTVTEAQPAPFTDGQETVGSVGGSAATNDVISGVVLPAGTNATNYNFGEVRPQNPFLSGTVYLDADRDGTLDTNETGISGVTVQLLDPGADGVFGTGDDTTTTTTTDANGNYNFPNLVAGREYRVIETQPAIFGSSTPNTIAVPPLPATGLTGQNFGETLGSISGSVYFDANTSGTRTAGEPGISGVTVTLTGTDANGNPVSRTTTTDANGNYRFDALPAGTYIVSEPTQPAGYADGLESLGTAGGAPGNDTFTAIPLSGGATATNYDFGEIGVPVSGTVFLDRDRDGTRDGGEPGIPGVTIQLIDANGTVVRTTTTDANGNYTFPNVPPGNYTIRELQPTGYGNPPAGTFAPDTRPITVAGTPVTNQNFGDTLSTLPGTVFVDGNNDGVQQGGEAGIPNTPVALDFAGADNVFGTADDVPNFRTTGTNANGDYLFTDLFSGVYRVRETQPAPYTDGIDTPGSAGGDATTNDQITAIPVGAGTDLTEYNFGEVQPANPFISGNVYVDLDNDGVRDANEPPISGVTVTLTDGVNPPITVTTDANGNYTFTNLTAGANYTITETQPNGFANGLENGGNTISVTNLPATGSTNNNFGETLGSIAGTVFFDRNVSNALDGADVRLPGVTVTLTGTDANNNPVTRTTTTDANGNYLFDQLLAGTYTVTETQPAQFNDGAETIGTAGGSAAVNDAISAILLSAGTNATNYDFGEVGANISGRVYLDPNRDGVRQAGETTSLGGVTITLFDANGTVVATTVTAGDGTYSFTNLPPGNYTLVQMQPNTHLSTSANVIPVTLTAAGVVNQDFGEDLGSISGSVFRDVNNNGTREAGEGGIEGVTVTLTGTDVNGNPISRTTTTDANGNYTFTGLPAGEYQIEETQPTAFQDGQERVGTAGGNATTNDRFSTVPLAAGTNATDYTFGEVTSSLSGFVYRDFNLDGTRSLTGANPDTGIAGITVTLTGTDDDGRPVNRTTTTGADGSYRFEGLGSGAYTITETQPPLPTTLTNGFYDGADNLGSLNGTNGTKNQFAVTLGRAQNGANYNFGELPPADPFGFVYTDLNRNGVRDAGEPGISGVAITISGTAFAGTIFARPITGADVPGGSLTVLTDANGRWEFNPIPPGLYQINEAQPAGYADGLESDGDPNGPPVTVGNDVFANILLNPFPIRGPFNFGEILPEVTVPPVTPPLTADQINKSMFLGSTPGQVMNMPTGPQFTNSVARLGIQSPVRSIGVAVGSGAGVGARAQLYDFRTGQLRVSFSFPGFTGGVRAAAGDVTGDGIDDLVVSFGAGADPIVAVFDGATGGLTRAFLAFPNFYKGGANVAVGDVNNDGFADIVVTPEVGVVSLVRVFDGRTSAQTAEFLAFPSFYTGGARIAVGDITGDGFADIVAGTATQAGFVAAYSGRDFAQILLGPAFGGAPVPGVNVAVGDTDGDGIAEILTTAGAGGTSFLETRQIAGANARTAITNLGIPAALGPGPRMATADINGDSAADLILSTSDTTRVRVVSGRTGNLLDDFFAFDPFMPTGVFVG
jgi:fimbrial isopeptide formation D2 family protein/uncharacterized repeat protein (TIGR01451 family)